MEPKVSMRVNEDKEILVTYEIDWETHVALGTAALVLLGDLRKGTEKVSLENKEKAALTLLALSRKIMEEKKRLLASLG